MGISTAIIQADIVTDYQSKAIYGISFLIGMFMYLIGLGAAPIMAWIFDDPRLIPLVAYQNLVFFIGAPKSILWSILARELDSQQLQRLKLGLEF